MGDATTGDGLWLGCGWVVAVVSLAGDALETGKKQEYGANSTEHCSTVWEKRIRLTGQELAWTVIPSEPKG